MIFLLRYKCYISQTNISSTADDWEWNRNIEYRYKINVIISGINIFVYLKQKDISLVMDPNRKTRFAIFIFSRKHQLWCKTDHETYYILPHSEHSIWFDMRLYIYGRSKFILRYNEENNVCYVYLRSPDHLPYYVKYNKQWKDGKHINAAIKMDRTNVTLYINNDMANLADVKRILSKLKFNFDNEELPSLTNNVDKVINIITPNKRYLISLELREVKI